MSALSADEMQAWLLDRYNDLSLVHAYGERTFFVNPNGRLPHGAYFATIKEADGPNDQASELDRDRVWRLSFGLPKSAFATLFGPPPSRPAKGGVVEGPWDFTALDHLTPHPVYGWMGWVAVLCPMQPTIERHAKLLNHAYERAQLTAAKRLKL